MGSSAVCCGAKVVALSDHGAVRGAISRISTFSHCALWMRHGSNRQVVSWYGSKGLLRVRGSSSALRWWCHHVDHGIMGEVAFSHLDGLAPCVFAFVHGYSEGFD
ncbi:hypothetical protein L3X38_037116 [Prunus dulcis]|uniref:Uncharacterized protein n=1 Tax=Prunus dulcis TaxID=3755 RepID=A0AAD4YQD2_PRUDU|nr:hypothetical protein L3X38_037116 [Prunus dulcis]